MGLIALISGEVKKYDTLLKKKLRLVKKYKLPLTAIYPKDLFPKNKLAALLEVRDGFLSAKE